MLAPLKIFCCYAREDQSYLEKLKKHLIPLQRQGHIHIWSDTDINAGDDWEVALLAHLSNADIVLLLISPDFMNSDYCYSTEMDRAIAYHDQGTTRVIPILIHPVYWQGAPFAKLQMLPTNATPVTDRSWHTENDALYNITKEISIVVIKLRVEQLEREAEMMLMDLYKKRLFKSSDYAQPLAFYEQIIQLKPDYARAYERMSDLFLHQKKYGQALNAYEKAQELDATFTNHLKKARILSYLERYQESLAALEQELVQHPASEPDVCASKAEIYLLLIEPDKALEMFERLTQLMPDNAMYFSRAGSLLIEMHKYKQAETMYVRATQLQPAEREYHAKLGKVYYKLGKHAHALATYQKAVEIDAKSSAEEINIAQLQLILQQYEEAIASFTSSIESGESDPALFHYRSRALQAIGQSEKALDDTNMAIALSTPLVDPRFLEQKHVILEAIAQKVQKQAQEARLAWIKQERFSLIPESVTLLEEFAAHPDEEVNCLAITPDGQRLFSGSNKGKIKEWMPGVAETQFELNGHSHAILHLSISANGRWMVSSSFKGSIKIWDLLTMSWDLITRSTTGIYYAAISPDGTKIASSDNTFDIKIWDRPLFSHLGAFTIPPASTTISHTVSLSSTPTITLFSLDNEYLLVGHTNGSIEKIAASTGEKHNYRPHTEPVSCLALSPNNKIVISGSKDHKISLWEVQTEQHLHTLQGHTDVVHSVAVHPDGQLLASSSSDGTIRYWNLKTGELLYTLDSMGNAISLVFHPQNGVLYAGYTDGIIRVWNML